MNKRSNNSDEDIRQILDESNSDYSELSDPGNYKKIKYKNSNTYKL